MKLIENMPTDADIGIFISEERRKRKSTKNSLRNVTAKGKEQKSRAKFNGRIP
jgi:hypothetical protein